MDRILSMQVFARVARLSSFSAAARELRLSPAAVSRHVAQLEAHLGIRLVERTTRRVRPTEWGERYLARCEQIVEDLEALEFEVGSGQGGATGSLRVSAGVVLGEDFVAPLLPEFLAENPALQVELVLSDAYQDLVESGIDVSVRAGPLDDSTLRSRRLGETLSMLVASPSFLEERGMPKDLEEVVAQSALCDSNRREPLWTFPGEKGLIRLRPRSRLTINHPKALCAAAIQGLGIALLPHFAVAKALASGELVEVLPERGRTPIPIQAVSPAHRERTLKAERFVEFLLERFEVPAAQPLS
ncbi:MAG: LysR family transcriptional regulator [Myxococcota bacterium]